MMTIIAESRCIKCGHTSPHSYQYVPRMGIYSGNDGTPHIGPCIVRTCQVCGYSYKEATKDGEGNDGHSS